MRKWLDELSVPSGAAAVAIIVAALGYYIIKGQFNLVMTGLTVLAIVLLAVFFYGNSAAIKGSIGARQMKYGSNTFIMVVAFLGILVLGNILISRNTQRWDLTASQDFSLSEQTLKILADLKEPVKVTGFFSGQDPRRQKAEDLLKEYSTRSDKITAEFIDPDLRPAEAQKYQILDYGTMVFQSGSRRQDTANGEESDITSAILKVTSGEQKRLAFLTGHGERAIDKADRAAYSQVKALLDGNNYKVETINLTTSPTLTTDIAVLVIASPRTALLDHERNAITHYLETGGRALILGDPGTDVGLNDLLQKWGIEIGKGVAVDQSMSFLNDVGTLVVQQFRYSAITKDLKAMAVFPIAANITTKNPDPERVTLTPLFDITDMGWVEMDPRVAKFDEGIDVKGPVSLAVAVEELGKSNSGDEKTLPKLVVFGDSDFAANQFAVMGANPDLFVSAVNWLAQPEQQVNIKPKLPTDRSVVLTGAQGNFIMFSSGLLLPGMVLAAGAVVWWRRR